VKLTYGTCGGALLCSLEYYGHCDALKQFEENSHAVLKTLAQELGAERFLLHPPCENPMNIIDYRLCLITHKAWLDSFFKAANFKRKERQTSGHLKLYSVLSRVNSTVVFKFTYDQLINLIQTNF
jgi:hypothetical protein